MCQVYIYIPGSSRYVKFLPLVVFFGEKAQILHTWKIQVYIMYNNIIIGAITKGLSLLIKPMVPIDVPIYV